MLIRDIQRALRQKLDAKPVGGSKHERFAVYDPDKPHRKLCTVGFSRGKRSIDDESLLRHIAVNELCLPSLEHFKALTDCSLDGTTALGLIRDSASR